MGHIGVKGLRSAVDGVPFDDATLPSCSICARANIKRSPFPPKALHRATNLLERIHCDICGPLPSSYGSYRYFILFICCYSRYIFLYPMKTRDEAHQHFVNFRTLAQNFSGQQIKILRVDNAPELIRGQLEAYCRSSGISYEKTVPDSPSQNGVAERCNLTLASMARAMLLDANLSEWFWPFAIQTAAHIKNRVLHSNLPPHTTPFQFWYHYKPNLSYMRPFGAPCTSRILPTPDPKFAPRGESGRFLGYAKDAKGYILWINGSVKIRRDVAFHDFPSITEGIGLSHMWDDITFPKQDVYESYIRPPLTRTEKILSSDKHPHNGNNGDPRDTTGVPGDVARNDRVAITPNHSIGIGGQSHIRDTVPIPESVIGIDDQNVRAVQPIPEQVTHNSLRIHTYIYSLVASAISHSRPTRVIHPPRKYADYLKTDSLILQLSELDDDEIRIPLDETFPLISALETVASTDALLFSLRADDDPDPLAYFLHDDDASDPLSIPEARQSKYWAEWLSAIQEELTSLKVKGVYEETDTLPPGRKPIQCKWVLHIKRDKDGTISRFKARLVAKGFTQIPGQDFSFTFAPVARWDSIRTLLSIATIKDYEIRQLDVKTAYLNGPLDEEIYMRPPDGFSTPSTYWHLKKGLYGLRQAGRQWYLTLHQAYTELGYTRCESDWSVYKRSSSSGSSMSATSVDDILFASDSKVESDSAAHEINDKFTTTDCGDASWILGCRITRNRAKRILMIDQYQFTSTILREFGMDKCNSVNTPCSKKHLTMDMCPKTDAERDDVASLPYKAIVGKCMYLSTCTRPDIAFAVRNLARFMSNFGRAHFEAAKFLLRYLQGTRSRGIIYGDVADMTPLFRCFGDADWATTDDRKSISGYVVLCGGGPIAWSSKQQSIVALSSCEAEYVACTHSARQIIWLRSIFSELGFPQSHATVLFCDNQGTVTCSHDPHNHSRMKHIDIRAHFVRDCVNRRIIDIKHIPGTQNSADLFTKPLEKVTHEKWLCSLRLDISQETIEG